MWCTFTEYVPVDVADVADDPRVAVRSTLAIAQKRSHRSHFLVAFANVELALDRSGPVVKEIVGHLGRLFAGYDSHQHNLRFMHSALHDISDFLAEEEMTRILRLNPALDQLHRHRHRRLCRGWLCMNTRPVRITAAGVCASAEASPVGL